MTAPPATDFAELSWSQVEAYLAADVRVVLPLGATEEHGHHLSLATDSLVVDRVTAAACRRSGVLRAPVMPFGCSAFATCYPGTLSLRTETLCRVIEDQVDCLYRQGFRRLVYVTGHGGNEVVTGVLSEVQLDRPGLVIHYRSAWAGMDPEIRRLEAEHGLPRTEHAAWHEVFPFTTVAPLPAAQGERVKTQPDDPDYPAFPLNPRTARHYLGDGVVGGRYDLGDAALMDRLLAACIDELAGFLDRLPPRAPVDPETPKPPKPHDPRPDAPEGSDR